MIIMPIEIARSLSEKAVESRPLEMCGLAIGRLDKQQKIVEEVKCLKNIDPFPSVAYTADLEELVESLNAIEDSGKTVIGIFHSHPAGPSIPSMVDSNRVAWIDHSHIIVVPGDELNITSWLWDDVGKEFVREELKIIS